MPPLNLSSTDQLTQQATSTTRLGNINGGGQNFAFGGINDSPAGKRIWIALAAALAGAGLLLYFTRKSK